MLCGLTSHSFSCASIQLQQIKDQTNISGIRETLRRTTEDIDHEIVHNVLHTINQQCKAQAKLARWILALLTAAKEPMTSEAMCHALGMAYVLETQQFPSELEKDFIPDVGVLVKCCEGLITIDPMTRLVTLAQDDRVECMRRQRSAHLSGSISGTCGLMDHFLDQEMMMLANVSVAYLFLSIFTKGPCHQIAALRKRLDEYPFLEYAARHWGYHARELVPLPSCYWNDYLKSAIRLLLRKAKNLESIYQIRDLDADLLRLLEASRMDKEHDQALDTTRIRTGISTLQVVSAYGLEDMVRDSLAQNPPTSFKPDSFGTSAIHEAAHAGWDDIVNILIEAGADPLPMDLNGKSPLYYAARNGRDEVISVFEDCDQMQDNYYELVLAFREAIEAGEAHVVIRLLEFVGQDTIREASITLLSIRAGHLDILETLWDHGANWKLLLVVSPSDRIALHQTIKHGRTDMAQLLLRRGANIQTLDDKKRNALFETLKAPNTDGLFLLLDHGIDVDCRDREGNTVLHQAAVDGAIEHTRVLICHGKISKTTFNDEGLTPLHLAARADQLEIADMLLKCEGVDVNTEATGRATGWTPLIYAVVAGSMRLCDMLIRRGADVSEKEDIKLSTVYKLAFEGDDRDLETYFDSIWLKSGFGSNGKTRV